MRKKAILGMPFSWLFAILVGAFIIFIAIYAVSKLVSTQEYIIGTETAKKLSIIFDPLDVGAEAAKKPDSAKFSSETRIYNKCFLGNIFGKQEFSISSKSFNKWSKPSGEIEVVNKYVFSDELEGKEFFYFSKPLNFPFKISELIFMYTGEYCFVNPPNVVEDDIEALNLKNLYISNGSCSPRAKKVCFGDGGEECEINIKGLCTGYACESNFDYGSIRKRDEVVYYSGALVYGAIFGEEYNCNLERLMKRASQLAFLYYDELAFLESRGCGGALGSDLLGFGTRLNDITSENMNEVIFIQEQVNQLENKNAAMECKLW